jgi:hypothetical protein
MGRVSRSGWAAGLHRVARAGVREPIVAILLLTAIFTAISGRPVNGVLLAMVALSLAWDDARTRRRMNASSAARMAAAGPALRAEAPARISPPMPGRQRRLLILCGMAGGALFATVVGSFSRYSWPATVGVIGLATTVVAVSWRGPLRRRPDPGKLPRRGVMLWAGLLVAIGLWELAALFLQPGLAVTSYAHPTISALTDPLLTSHAGRSVALAIWVAIGWFLAER